MCVSKIYYLLASRFLPPAASSPRLQGAFLFSDDHHNLIEDVPLVTLHDIVFHKLRKYTNMLAFLHVPPFCSQSSFLPLCKLADTPPRSSPRTLSPTQLGNGRIRRRSPLAFQLTN